MPIRSVAVAALCAALALSSPPARAEDKPLGWSAQALLSGVWTGGNTDTSTLGFKARAVRDWSRSQFFLEGGGLKQTDDQTAFVAVGTPESFELRELSNPTTTAENYYAETGFERRLSDRLLWNVGGGWKRDLFSGIEHYVSGRAGVGYVLWTEKDRGELKAAVQVTVNNQNEVVEDPSTEETFVGLRGAFDFKIQFGAEGRSVFASRLALDENLQVTEDFRTDWNNTLTAAMTDRFALQVGGKLNFRNLPALRAVTLFSTPGPPVGTVLAPYEKLDTTFTVALVINWGPKPAKESLPKP